jgi:uncharacterized HAD superfamily protein
MNLEQDLKRITAEAYFLTPAMIRFLLIENLALKSLLHEKGLITPEEFAEHQQKAAAILDAKTDEHLKQQIKQMAEQRLRKPVS